MSGKYDDMLDLPHPRSERHARMLMRDRAAQFAPFAALTGYEEVLAEQGRRTDAREELSEEAAEEMRRLLTLLREGSEEPWEITFFVPDEHKTGGRYLTLQSPIRGVDEARRMLILRDRTAIPLDDLFRLERADG